MADIVRLQDRLAKSQKRAREGPCEAVVLMFTGVRYEYRDGSLVRAGVMAGEIPAVPGPKAGKDPMPH
ncbi:MAG: hypothetical protein WC048_12965 [Rhizobium sp.]|jgi:hypothetical protein